MARTNLSAFLRQLTRAAAAETLGDQSDRQLVERFLASGDEAVFEAIVRRHGPMVYRVCWRALGQEQDAEDAFQATFLLLAQKLRSVRKHTSLASWLHGVARRVALKARAQAAARRHHEQQLATPPSRAPDEVTWREVCAVLDGELARLPEKWRQPLILCYLEGRTQDEAARQLGWGKTTLRRRLGEGRAALGRRLSRHGIGPAALSGLLLSECVGSAALSTGLIGRTVEAMVCLTAGHALTTAASAPVIALTEGVRTTMPFTKSKVASAALLIASVLVTGVGLASYKVSAEPPAVHETAFAPVPRKPPPGKVVQDKLVGTWVMTLPRGFQYQVVVRRLGPDRYSLGKAVRFSGIYELRKDRLTRIGPEKPVKERFIWEVRDDKWVLVGQPPVGKTGANYLGATLERKKENKGPVPKKQPGPAARKPAAKIGGDQKDISREEAKAARDLERLEAKYRLTKEPAYRAPVQYCLLLLGPGASTRMWLASDGVTMYVDRNGNGDLTDPGEAVPFREAGFAFFHAEKFPGGAANAHTDLHIAVRQRDWKNNKGGYWSVRARVEGRYPMYAFAHKFPHKPENAPVIHLGGPLRMGLYQLEGGSLQCGGQPELNATIVCQYPGVEKAFVDVDRWTRKDIHPLAEVHLPARAPGIEPITLRVPLTRHC
jgi:RNA polymerase sigma factor (sigma-70 family)